MELLERLRRRWTDTLGRAGVRSAQVQEYRDSIAEWEGREGMADVVELLRGKVAALGEASDEEVEARVFLAGAKLAEGFGNVEGLGDPREAVCTEVDGGIAYFPTAAAAARWEARNGALAGGQQPDKRSAGKKKGRISEVDKRKVIGLLGKGKSVVETSRIARRSVDTVRDIAGKGGIALKVCEMCGSELSSAFFEERPGAHNLEDGLSRACKKCIREHRRSEQEKGKKAEDVTAVMVEAPKAQRTPLSEVPSIDPQMAAMLEAAGVECAEDLLSFAEGMEKGKLRDALHELDVPMGTAIHVAGLVCDGTIEKEIGGGNEQA